MSSGARSHTAPADRRPVSLPRLAEMKANGARLIEADKMVFVHPSEGHGVLYQLVERK